MSKAGMRFCVEAAILLGVFYFHLILTPFTKVEESFNVQASFDLLFKSWKSLSQFDHVYFPGVVPRTFIGPLVLTTIARFPINIFHLSHLSSLHVTRAVLATLVATSFLAVRSSVSQLISPRCASLFITFTIVQFHIAYYASRLLPNIFALIFTNFALADYLSCIALNTPSSSLSISSTNSLVPRALRCIALLAIAVALFRSELVLLLFPTVMMLSIHLRKVSFLTCCIVALGSAVVTACVSIVVDSYFWQRWTYPELEVFIFNAIKGGSSAWGTSPAHWYWTNAIPRAIGGALPLALIGTTTAPKVRQQLMVSLLCPAVFFIGIYSALPHKELRFIFYGLPYFNVCACLTLDSAILDICEHWGRADDRKKKDDDDEDDNISDGRGKDKNKEHVTKNHRTVQKKSRVTPKIFVILMGVGSIGLSVMQTGLSLSVSRWNYASGHALKWLVKQDSLEQRNLVQQFCEMEKRLGTIEVSVHMDVDAAMNGISQFVYGNDANDDADDDRNKNKDKCRIRWRFNKEENLRDDGLLKYDYLLTEQKDVVGFRVVYTEQGYGGMKRVWEMASSNGGGFMKFRNKTYVQKREGMCSQVE